jgi:single-strand DNA-binding protein
MSRSLNRVTLIGNVGADPEIRTTPGGGRVAQFSVATSRRWTGQGGETQEKTEWHRVVAWDNARGAKLANLCEQYVKKGDKIYVEGRIEYRQWEDKEKQTRYATEIIAYEIILLGGRGGAGGDDSRPARTPAKAKAAAAGAAGAAGDGDFETFDAEAESEDDDLPF